MQNKQPPELKQNTSANSYKDFAIQEKLCKRNRYEAKHTAKRNERKREIPACRSVANTQNRLVTCQETGRHLRSLGGMSQAEIRNMAALQEATCTQEMYSYRQTSGKNRCATEISVTHSLLLETCLQERHLSRFKGTVQREQMCHLKNLRRNAKSVIGSFSYHMPCITLVSFVAEGSLGPSGATSAHPLARESMSLSC